ALPPDAAGGDQPAVGGVRPAGRPRRLQAGAVGLRQRLRGDAAVRAAAVPAQDRDGPARGGLAAEPGVRRLHLPGAAADRLGRGAREPPAGAAALVLPLDRPAAAAAGGAVLR